MAAKHETVDHRATGESDEEDRRAARRTLRNDSTHCRRATIRRRFLFETVRHRRGCEGDASPSRTRSPSAGDQIQISERRPERHHRTRADRQVVVEQPIQQGQRDPIVGGGPRQPTRTEQRTSHSRTRLRRPRSPSDEQIRRSLRHGADREVRCSCASNHSGENERTEDARMRGDHLHSQPSGR